MSPTDAAPLIIEPRGLDPHGPAPRGGEPRTAGPRRFESITVAPFRTGSGRAEARGAPAPSVPRVSPHRIFIDHGEAYGNLGDEAMLLNALRRLQALAGPCEFTLPVKPEQPLPEALPPVQTTASALAAFEELIRPLRRGLRRCARVTGLPVLERVEPALWRAATWLADRVVLADGGLARWARRWLPLPRTFCNALLDYRAALRQSEAFYSVGAADLSDFWPAGVIYKEWLYRLARRTVPLVIVSSQGVGPLENAALRRRARRALGHAHHVSFRDYEQSLRLFDEGEHHGNLPVDDSSQLESPARRNDPSAGVSPLPSRPQVAIVGDEAFTLPPADEERAWMWLGQAGVRPGVRFVACHFRATDYTRDTRMLVPRLAGLLDRLSHEQRITLVFMPMSYARHSCIDRELGLALRNAMNRTDALLIPPECRDVTVVKAAVGLARFSLGLSYHVHVFSLSQGHPALILYTGGYYRAKSDGLIGFYGAPSQALDLDLSDDAAVLHATAEIERRYADACAEIARVNQALLGVNDLPVRALARRVRQGRGPGR